MPSCAEREAVVKETAVVDVEPSSPPINTTATSDAKDLAALLESKWAPCQLYFIAVVRDSQWQIGFSDQIFNIFRRNQVTQWVERRTCDQLVVSSKFQVLLGAKAA